MNKTKTTYASRLAARQAKRNRPVSVLSKRATQRRAGLHAARMTRLYAIDAGDVPAGEVTK